MAGGDVIDLRTRGVIFPPVEPLPPEAEVLAELLAAFERAAEHLDPDSAWGEAVSRSVRSLSRHLAFADARGDR